MACGICGSTNTRSGSWTPARCLNCGAMESPGGWYYDPQPRTTIEDIRKESGYSEGVLRKIRNLFKK